MMCPLPLNDIKAFQDSVVYKQFYKQLKEVDWKLYTVLFSKEFINKLIILLTKNI